MNATTVYGATPLTYAAWKNMTKVAITLLQEYKANPNVHMDTDREYAGWEKVSDLTMCRTELR